MGNFVRIRFLDRIHPSGTKVMDATSPPTSSSNMDTTNGGGTPVSSSIEEQQQPPMKKARKEMDDDRVQRAALFMIKSQLLSVPQVNIMCSVCVLLITNCVVYVGGGRDGMGGMSNASAVIFFHL